MRWVSKGVKGLQQREKGLNDRICRCDSVKLVPCFLRVDEDVDDVTDVLRAATGRVEPRVTSVHVHRRTHASLLHTKHYLRSFTFHNTHDPTQSPKPTRPPFVKYRVGQKNRGHFVLWPINLEILNRSLPNLAQIKVSSFWTSCQNLFKSTSENNGAIQRMTMTLLTTSFKLVIIFLHHFSQTCLHCYFTFC